MHGNLEIKNGGGERARCERKEEREEEEEEEEKIHVYLEISYIWKSVTGVGRKCRRRKWTSRNS